MVKIEQMLSDSFSHLKAGRAEKVRQKNTERLRQLQDVAWLLESGLLPVFQDVAQTLENQHPKITITTPTGNPSDIMRLQLLFDPKREKGGVSCRILSAVVRDDHAVIRQGENASVPISINSGIGEIELKRRNKEFVNQELARKLLMRAATSEDNPKLRTRPQTTHDKVLSRIRGNTTHTLEIHTT